MKLQTQLNFILFFLIILYNIDHYIVYYNIYDIQLILFFIFEISYIYVSLLFVLIILDNYFICFINVQNN
uniref:Uncharacterized protein n=1 Tax=Faxonius propinquus nudivirus TaxID=3139431 RepID=A0AAU8GCY6_9VIRU